MKNIIKFMIIATLPIIGVATASSCEVEGPEKEDCKRCYLSNPFDPVGYTFITQRVFDRCTGYVETITTRGECGDC